MAMLRVIDERVLTSFAYGVRTQYLMEYVNGERAPEWIFSANLVPELLEPVSRRALFGGADAHEYGFDEDGNRLSA